MNNLEKSNCGTPAVVGLIVLMIFLFFRPITVSVPHIGNVSILDLFGIISSSLLVLGVLVNFKRVRLDLTSSLILFFSMYCFTGLALGAELRDVARMILPFFPFFLVKAIVRDEMTIAMLLKVLASGYFIPITTSFVMILLGTSSYVVTGSMVARQAGLASGVHTQGHLMLFFSFVFSFYFLLYQGKKPFRVLMLLLLFGSLYCAYKTYTRTVILGGLIFWFSHLFFWKRKLFVFLLIVSLLISAIFWSNVKNLLTQEKAVSNASQEFDVNAASSGRIWIWKHNLKLFYDLPLYTKLSGVGLGNELKNIPGEPHKQWYGSHNDYMSLLITTGILGLMLYLMIYGSVFFFLLGAPLEFRYRAYGISVLVSVLVMNFVSNSYIVRFQMAQLFWFLIGLLYAMSLEVENRNQNSCVIRG